MGPGPGPGPAPGIRRVSQGFGGGGGWEAISSASARLPIRAGTPQAAYTSTSRARHNGQNTESSTPPTPAVRTSLVVLCQLVPEEGRIPLIHGGEEQSLFIRLSQNFRSIPEGKGSSIFLAATTTPRRQSPTGASPGLVRLRPAVLTHALLRQLGWRWDEGLWRRAGQCFWFPHKQEEESVHSAFAKRPGTFVLKLSFPRGT